MLLSDEFMVFAKKVGEWHALKKAKNDEFKAQSDALKVLYEQHKVEIGKINTAVEKLQEDWDKFCAEQTAKEPK